MDAISPAPEISQPNREPASDALFGDSAALDNVRDAESLFHLMMPENIRFFDLQVLERLHRRPYHLLKVRGAFDLARLVKDHQNQLRRSESYQTLQNKTHIERLMFALSEDVLVVYEMPNLMVYAPTTQAAVQVAAELKKYRKLKREKPGFRLVSLATGQPSAQLITIKPAEPFHEDEIGLHYGDDFVPWERAWLERLGQRPSGVSILFGPPGCGKTSYLRGLMSRLIDKCSFYYIPASAFDVLSNPRFVSFWIDEKYAAGGKQRIAIMEDSESLLLPRDSGSQTDVSNLLNIADGFLGEHLKLQVIATTNSPVRQLDPALLRPGRLMGTREFRRLSRPEAQRLAAVKGLTLPDQNDFSLAELYCGAVGNPALNGDRQVGFAP